MVIKILIIILLGGLLELERTSVFQGLLSEPIVVAPAVGWLMGDVMLGVQTGVLLQLFFLGAVSIGGTTPRDGTLAAVAVAGSAAVAESRCPGMCREALTAASALLLMVPASRLGGWIDGRIKENGVRAAHLADDRVPEEGEAAVEKIIHRSLLEGFLVWTAVMAVGLLAGSLALAALLNVLPGEVLSALERAGKLLPLAAAGVALSAVKIRRADWWYAATCVVLLVISAKVW